MRVLTLGGVRLGSGAVVELLAEEYRFGYTPIRFLVHDPIAVIRDDGEEWALMQGSEQLWPTGGSVSRLILVRASALAGAIRPPAQTMPPPLPTAVVGREFSTSPGGPRR